MQTYNSKYFGTIDAAQTDDYYEGNVNYNGSTPSLDFFLDDIEFNISYFQIADEILDQLASIDHNIRLAMQQDLINGIGETQDYIAIFLDEFEEEALNHLIDIKRPESTYERQLLDALRISWIRIHPDSEEDRFATIEYTFFIDNEPCNHVLEMDIDFAGNPIGEFYWES